MRTVTINEKEGAAMKQPKKPQDPQQPLEEVQQPADVEAEAQEPQEGQTEFEQVEEDLVNSLQEQIGELSKARDEYLNLAQRVQADFDNFRKRNASVRADALEEGNRKAVTALLPVLDNMERTLQAMAAMEESYRAGAEMVLRQMVEVLHGLGLEEIPAEGQAFDPQVHEAVMQGPADAEHPAGTVLAVMQKGYTVKGRVVRASMVQVAQ